MISRPILFSGAMVRAILAGRKTQTRRVVPSLGGPYRDGFRDLWESINGAGSWVANPWVWATSFRIIP